jgi:O-acetylserine/cysteine efflux transporter
MNDRTVPRHDGGSAAGGPQRAPLPVVLAVALGLYLLWSNSFIAVEYLLGDLRHAGRFDWIGLTVVRFLPAAAFCAAYCLGWRRRRSWELLKAHPARVAVCAALSVPLYNLALYYGQQHGVPAPIASLVTTLAPVFMFLLAAPILGERLTWRRLGGLVVALGGMLIVSRARASRASAYPLMVAVTALAPLCWSLFSVFSKPMTDRYSPTLWTFLVLAVSFPFLLAALPFAGGAGLRYLDGAGWFAVLFLAFLCTVLGFALWNWLLGQLPASSVGFFVFLNPPLTMLSKLVLARTFPSTFTFTFLPSEALGALVTLGGVALALTDRWTNRGRSSPRRSR